MTVNQASRLDLYPLPRVDELFATLVGGKTFSKLDLQHAYLQLPLETNSKQYTTINTHRGLFQYNRLHFGVSSAPGIFQRAIDDLVKGIPHVAAYMDDILLTGETQEQHLQNWTALLERLKTAGVRLKKPKCLWQRRWKKAIQEAQQPHVTELKSFLGLLSYYSKFLPNDYVNNLVPTALLQKNRRWKWRNEQQKASRPSCLYSLTHSWFIMTQRKG